MVEDARALGDWSDQDENRGAFFCERDNFDGLELRPRSRVFFLLLSLFLFTLRHTSEEKGRQRKHVLPLRSLTKPCCASRRWPLLDAAAAVLGRLGWPLIKSRVARWRRQRRRRRRRRRRLHQARRQHHLLGCPSPSAPLLLVPPRQREAKTVRRRLGTPCWSRCANF